jgi:SAM-dependent methyltransferase
VLELGCGASRFLPQLALAAGVEVAGVDFSEEGVAQTRRALEGVGVDCGEIALGAIETYVPRVEGSFDAVVSFGLVEHFDDLEAIVAQHFRCARPGGRVFVEAPNLAGPNLAWMRRVAPSLLEWHRPLDAEKVAAAFRAAGATDLSVEHLGGLRLFAPPDPGRLAPGARVVRKTVNGLGELASRVAPRASTRLAGAPLSAYFAVSGTRSR